MVENQVGELLLDLAQLFALTYLLAGLLEHFRIPGILAALFVAMALHYTPIGDRLYPPNYTRRLHFWPTLACCFYSFISACRSI